MAYQYSAKLRDARMQAVVSTIGRSPTLKLFAGIEPLSCESADPPNLLATLQLPKQPFTDSVDGIITKGGEWSGEARGIGHARSFRLCNSAGCCLQGSVGVAGQQADMLLDETALVPGQKIVVANFAIVGSHGSAAPGRPVIDDSDIEQQINALQLHKRIPSDIALQDGQSMKVLKDGRTIIREKKHAN